MEREREDLLEPHEAEKFEQPHQAEESGRAAVPSWIVGVGRHKQVDIPKRQAGHLAR